MSNRLQKLLLSLEDATDAERNKLIRALRDTPPDISIASWLAERLVEAGPGSYDVSCALDLLPVLTPKTTEYNAFEMLQDPDPVTRIVGLHSLNPRDWPLDMDTSDCLIFMLGDKVAAVRAAAVPVIANHFGDLSDFLYPAIQKPRSELELLGTLVALTWVEQRPEVAKKFLHLQSRFKELIANPYPMVGQCAAEILFLLLPVDDESFRLVLWLIGKGITAEGEEMDEAWHQQYPCGYNAYAPGYYAETGTGEVFHAPAFDPIPLLTQALEDVDELVRIGAIYGLEVYSCHNAPSVFPLLPKITAMRDNDISSSVRQTAEELLKCMCSPE